MVSHGAKYMSRRDYVGALRGQRKSEQVFDLELVKDKSYFQNFTHLSTLDLLRTMIFHMKHIPHTKEVPFDAKDHITTCDITWEHILEFREQRDMPEDIPVIVTYGMLFCGDGVAVKRNPHGQGSTVVCWSIRGLDVCQGIGQCVWGGERVGFVHRF